VNSTLRKPDLRECQLCRRDLSLGCFGMRRENIDSYNNVCKECTRYLRKRYYYNRLESLNRPNHEGRSRSLSYIFPLNEQNRAVLTPLLDSPFERHIIPAEFIKTGQPVSIHIIFNEIQTLEIIIPGQSPNSSYRCSFQDRSQFIKTAVRILHDLRIRLS
jgi:hypothetical protein